MIIKQAIDLIKSYESFSPNLYICPAGFKTIGYGHVVKRNEKFNHPITHAMALELLMNDILIAKISVINNIKVALNKYQLGALVSFTFNVGGGALQRSTLRQKINYHDHDQVPEELMKWVFAAGKKSTGLINRRHSEACLYQTSL